MLTYALIERCEDIILKNVETYPSVFKADKGVGNFVFVYKHKELVLILNIHNLWTHWLRGDATYKGMTKWGRIVERHIRLRLKLRARRARLRAKQCCDTAPQKQSTGEARPAA